MMWRERNILVMSDNDLLLRVVETHLRQPGLRVTGRPLALAGAGFPTIEADLIVLALSGPNGVSWESLVEQAGPTPLLIIADRFLENHLGEHVHCLALPFDAVALRRQVGMLLQH
jgi:hypothetical protein